MLRNITTLLCCVAALFALNFITSVSSDPSNLTASLKNAPTQNAAHNEAGKEEKPIELPLELEALSVCVFDVIKNEFIFEINAEQQLPLASITKLMTALVAKENLPQNTHVEISKKALMQEGDSGFYIGNEWQLSNILKAMLISSSNDAAFAVSASLRDTLEPSDTKFVSLMNERAKELGLNQTYYINTSGLDLSKEEAGAFGSCKDMTKLMNYILSNYPDLIEITTEKSFTANEIEFKNTNKLLSEFPCFFGGKTGFSDLAGGNLIVAVGRGLSHPMILTVLGSSWEGRFEDVKKLYDKFVK